MRGSHEVAKLRQEAMAVTAHEKHPKEGQHAKTLRAVPLWVEQGDALIPHSRGNCSIVMLYGLGRNRGLVDPRMGKNFL
jgi:hypothetical protein